MVPWSSLRSPKQVTSRGRDRVRAARAKELEMDSSEGGSDQVCERTSDRLTWTPPGSKLRIPRAAELQEYHSCIIVPHSPTITSGARWMLMRLS